jgi:hypothetical protein
MKKVMRIGKIKVGEYRRNVFVKADYDIFIKATNEGGELSLSGVIGPMASGNAYGGSGQIDMEFQHRNPSDDDRRYSKPTTPEEIDFAPGWDKEKWFDLLDIWKTYHLNDMQPACEHQRKDWDARKEVEIIEYSWSDKFYGMMQKAEHGELTAKEYSIFSDISPYVKAVVTAINRPKYPSAAVADLLTGGWIKEKKREHKAAGWVHEKEHPEGLLCRPCPVCGYKYGSAWLRMDVPQEIIDKLFNFPDADTIPAWI